MNAAAPLVRKEISTLTDAEVAAYAGAVKTMKEREPGNPLSWSYQANMHGVLQGEALKHLWAQCQHGTWYFLPWHRMYLYYFERIVRAAVGDEGWTLPYWNYCLGEPHSFLPVPFREPPDGGDSPLYVAERNAALNKGEEGMPVTVTSPAKALKCREFTGRAMFGGPPTGFEHSGRDFGVLEGAPHNLVHDAVEGLMGSPETAAQDPIFWLHHANIDRIWSEWIGAAGAGHQDPADEDWLKFEFSFFDETGDEVKMSAEQVLVTARQLGYVYDTEIAPAPAAAPPAAPQQRTAAVNPPERKMVGATGENITLTGEPVTVHVPIDAQAAEGFGEDVHAYLNVEEISGERSPRVSYLVYADLDGEPPSPESPRFLGTLSFFGIERARNPVGDAQPHSLGASYDITPMARELEARGEWAGHELPVTFAPLGLVPPGAAHTSGVSPTPHQDRPIQLGRLSVFYDA